MGVAGAGPFVQQLRGRKSQTPKIQERYGSLKDAFISIEKANEHSQHYTLLIDFWASFYGRAVSLCGKYIAPANTSEYIKKRYYSPDAPSADAASKFILNKLFKELDSHVYQAHEVFKANNKDLDICIVLDNHEASVKAKYLTKRGRSESRAKARKRHAAAVKRLENLVGRTSNHDRQAVNASYREAHFHPRHPRLRSRYGKRTLDSAIYQCIKDIRQTAWTQLAFDTSPAHLSSFLDSSKYTFVQEKVLSFSFAEQEDAQVKQDTLFAGDDDEDNHFSSLSDSNAGIPAHEHVEEAAATWRGLNSAILTKSTKLMIITSANEADLTILNLLSAKNGTTTSILMGNDSDYYFFTDEDDLAYTLSFSWARNKDARYYTKKPWVVTSISQLHLRLANKWPDRRARIIAALLAGHDYTGTGLVGAGLSSLRSYEIIDKRGLTSTLNRLTKHKSQYWSRARSQIEIKEDLPSFSKDNHVLNRLAHALRVLLLRQHRDLDHVTREAFDKMFDKATNSSSINVKKYINPYAALAIERRNIELLYAPLTDKETRRQHTVPSSQDIKRQRDFSSNLAQSPDTSLPQKRHAAWVYDISAQELTRKSAKKSKKSKRESKSSRPERAEELAPEIDQSEESGIKFYGPDDSADPDEDADGQNASWMAEDDEQDDEGDEPNQDGGEDGDDDEDDDNDETAGPKRTRKSSSSKAPARKRQALDKVKVEKPKKETAVQLPLLFPTKTHVRLMASVIQSLSEKDLRQKSKPAVATLQLLTFVEKLSIAQTLAPFYNEYWRRLLDDGDARYLYNYRTFEASTTQNAVPLMENFIRLLSPSTDGGGQFEFMSYSHAQSDSGEATLCGYIDTIAQNWAQRYVKAMQGEASEDLEARQASVKQVMAERLSSFSSTTITYLGSFGARWEIDYILAGMLDEYWSGSDSMLSTTVTTPLAPITYAFKTHAGPLYRAVKSKLRSRPLQKTLASFILQACERELNGLEKKAITVAHADLYNFFVDTSYTHYLAGQYSEDAAECHSRLYEVFGEGSLQRILRDLYNRVEATFHPSALSRSLRSFFEGKDKLQFGLKHIKRFLHGLGHDFSIKYAPTFVQWSARRIRGSVFGRECIPLVTSCTQWLNIHFLGHLQANLLAEGIPIDLARSMGCLDQMKCFEHCEQYGRGQVSRVLKMGLPAQLKLSKKWMDDMSHYVKAARAILKTSQGQYNDITEKNRSLLFDVMFKRCSIPEDEIWAGRFATDGYSLHILSHDPTTCQNSLARKILSRTYPQLHETEYPALTAGTLMQALSQYEKQSFCLASDYERETLGLAYRLGENGMTASYQILSTGAYIRRKLADRPLIMVSNLPSESTYKGIPKDIKRLDDGSREGIQAALDRRIGDSKQDRYAIIGNDLGIRVSQAIHINEMSQGADISKNESKTFLIKPHGLQEVSRKSVFIKNRLRERMPVSTWKILEAEKRKTTGGQLQLTSAYNLLDQSLKCSRQYCHQSFRHVQQTRRFYDRVSSQFIRTVWPDPAQPNMPVLFAIGDGCGIGNDKVIKHHADFSTSGLRQLVKRLKTQKYPVDFVLVDEAFTSQVCPDPNCKDEEGYRSKLSKLPYKDDLQTCLRVHQCERCCKAYHRDTAAAMNIGFVAWHVLKKGHHPWRGTA